MREREGGLGTWNIYLLERLSYVSITLILARLVAQLLGMVFVIPRSPRRHSGSQSTFMVPFSLMVLM